MYSAENNLKILLHFTDINQAHGKRISLNQIMVCLEQLSAQRGGDANKTEWW